MKVYYLSVSTYADSQNNLLHHLANQVDITYGVIIPNKRANYTEAELTDYCRKHNIKCEPFQLRYRFRDPRLIATYYNIIRSIKKADPDIIYFANYDQIYINMLLLMLNKEKMVIGFHDVENHSKTRLNFLTNMGKNVLFKNFKYFLTHSELQAEILKKRVRNKSVYTIPLPLIDFGEKPAVNENKEPLNLLFFGNILYYKGMDILLNAINRIAKKNDNFRLTIAGRSSDWNDLYEPLIENKEVVVKHVRFIENTEIPGFFEKADYLILPYRDTTQSGPLMIAYRYNVPVIASNAEGFREFIRPGVSGFMFDLKKENDLDRVLEDALNRPEQEYAALKKTQKDFVDTHFSINSIVNRYQNMFSDVLEARRQTV
jgi:glycosyltransferase involved in cell wall biosynthesis